MCILFFVNVICYSQILFEKASDYWKEAIRLAPTNYIEAQNWLKMTGRWTLAD